MATNFQPIVIGLLIAGLVVGAGAGYFISNNSMQQSITSLTSEKQTLENNISGKNNQITNLQANITFANGEITRLNGQKQGLTASVNQLKQTQAGKQQTVNELISEKTGLDAQIIPAAGYSKCVVYGLSFDYQVGWELDLSGVGVDVISSVIGQALATYNQGERDVGVYWIQVPNSEGLVANWWNNSLPTMIAQENTTLISRETRTIAGYQAEVITVSETIDGHFQYSKLAVFYSDVDGKLYSLQFNVPTQPELVGANRFFDSVRVGGLS